MVTTKPLLPIVLCILSCTALAQKIAPRVNPERIETRILALGKIGSNPEGGVSRVAFSEADVKGHEYLSGLMGEAGLEVHIDAAGNLLGRCEGTDPSLPPIMFGSHADSVPHGGNYDGPVGVIAAIECAQVLYELGVATKHPLEVVVFADEEGGLVGSRALIGHLGDTALAVHTHSGKTIAEGIEALGGSLEGLADVARRPGNIAAFIELHIEQGATLDAADIDIGIVEGIVGIEWWDVIVEGMANHAGTTPMDKRHDALLAAAQFVLAVNRVVTEAPGKQVGTVGKMHAEPGAHNVIPGRVVTSLELRDLSADKISILYQRIREETAKIAGRTGTKIEFTHLDVGAVPAPMHEGMRTILTRAAKGLGLSTLSMPSGAGHDAQDMARIAPTGMIFVPSRGGISHAPEEFTSTEDMANGANVLLQAILMIDAGALATTGH